MRYSVKTPDGELTYSNLHELSRAYENGLVDPEDDVREEGATKWRKAASFPNLVSIKRGASKRTSLFASVPMMVRVILCLVLGLMALYFISQGGWFNLVLATSFGLIVSILLGDVTYRAFKRKG